MFIPDEGRHAGQPFTIKYDAIKDLEFAQKVTRRAPLVAGATALLGPFGLLTLMSKSRAHFLTVAYTDDDGTVQVSIFEIGKSVAAATLVVVEARSGVQIEYQDDQARKRAGAP